MAHSNNALILSTRTWSVIGAMMKVQQVVLAGYTQVEVVLAIEAYQFECRRYETALYAYNTTRTEEN